jgi:hypothetical protein
VRQARATCGMRKYAGRLMVSATCVWLSAGLLLVSCFATGVSARVSRADELARPLHLPSLKRGAACPVSHPDRSVDFASYGVATGIGAGPAYPVMPRGVVFIQRAANFGSHVWGGQKVLWFVHPRYHGEILVRRRRIDGSGVVRFDRGDVPAAELRMPAGTSDRPSFTRLRAPGCYAYQVDGSNFSRVVVFEAVGSP